mmetsp:Transcript_31766/g.78742  ORF Transcript_31766/g.78742 Transcript_31766/m.78742 type:complete len:92 (+) Transcript_31766:598-873(+)
MNGTQPQHLTNGRAQARPEYTATTQSQELHMDIHPLLPYVSKAVTRQNRCVSVSPDTSIQGTIPSLAALPSCFSRRHTTSPHTPSMYIAIL